MDGPERQTSSCEKRSRRRGVVGAVRSGREDAGDAGGGVGGPWRCFLSYPRAAASFLQCDLSLPIRSWTAWLQFDTDCLILRGTSILNRVRSFGPHPLSLDGFPHRHVDPFGLNPFTVLLGVHDVSQRLWCFNLHDTWPFMGMNRLSHSGRDGDLQHANAAIFQDHSVTGRSGD